MCGKLTQYNASKTYREAAMVTVRFSIGQNQLSESEVPWLGHVRDDNPQISQMRRVVVPEITGMEHHGRGFTFSKPISLVGYVRELSFAGQTRPGLFLLTTGVKLKRGPDRFPVLDADRDTWREVVDKVWTIKGAR